MSQTEKVNFPHLMPEAAIVINPTSNIQVDGPNSSNYYVHTHKHTHILICIHTYTHI